MKNSKFLIFPSVNSVLIIIKQYAFAISKLFVYLYQVKNLFFNTVRVNSTQYSHNPLRTIFIWSFLISLLYFTNFQLTPFKQFY